MLEKVVFASSNLGKIKEIQASLKDVVQNIIPQSDYNVPDIEETGLTFIENAILKARNACKHTNLPAFADDSGLIVDSLNGEPGLYSARYAGKGCSNADNIAKLLKNMENIASENRDAKFFSVIAFLQHANDPAPQIFQGEWHGKILEHLSGTKGFGYDPIFFVPTHNCSAAELELDVKNKLSHRGKALEQLKLSLTKKL